jgi:hypothetical protein
MLKKLAIAGFIMFTAMASAEVIETDSTSTSTITTTNNTTTNNTNTNTSTVDSTSTVNSTSTNTNINTNTNVNTNTSTSTSTNTNNDTINSTSTSTSTNTNNNTNNNTSNNTNTNTNNNKSDVTQRVESPPPSAIAPSINNSNSDVCTVGFSGAVQTQVLGISGGGMVRDLNCERLKLAKTVYDMGMKVAAVSIMCGDPRVFSAMWMAGTPCPYEGKIGAEAKAMWEDNPDKVPQVEEQETRRNDTLKGLAIGAALAIGIPYLF